MNKVPKLILFALVLIIKFIAQVTLCQHSEFLCSIAFIISAERAHVIVITTAPVPFIYSKSNLCVAHLMKIKQTINCLVCVVSMIVHGK